ncbi:Uncharacterized protein DAT39_023166, partial [Clarias magur]
VLSHTHTHLIQSLGWPCCLLSVTVYSCCNGSTGSTGSTGSVGEECEEPAGSSECDLSHTHTRSAHRSESDGEQQGTSVPP